MWQGRQQRCLGQVSLVVGVLALGLMAPFSSAHADASQRLAGARTMETLNVVVDQAKVARIPAGTQTVVVGNPAIADVTIQKSGVMVVTGKTFGTTNMITLDSNGALISEVRLQVLPHNDAIMVLHKGTERESYNCSPNCERTVRLGDSEKYFSSVIGQTTSRNSFATQQQR